MTQQIINVGTAPNNGTGDPARTAFQKCNDNFTELYAGGSGVTSIIAGTGISVDQSTGNVTVTATGGGGGGVTGPVDSITHSFAMWTDTSGSAIESYLFDPVDNTNSFLQLSEPTSRPSGSVPFLLNYGGTQIGPSAGSAGATNCILGYSTARLLDRMIEGAESCTAVGTGALNYCTTGSGNTAIGAGALDLLTSGSDNTAIGWSAGLNATGRYNVAIGVKAGSGTFGTNTADGNVSIGAYAGWAITSGLNNVVIGYSADTSDPTGSNQIVIGQNRVGKGNDTAYIGGSSGAYNGANTTTWEVTSDERIKKNIVDSPVGLAAIKQIQVRNFNYKTDEEMPKCQDGNPLASGFDSSKKVTGAVAQELQKVMPDCVTENSTSLLSVNIDPLIWALVNAVKELSAEVELLKGNINAR